MKIPGQFPKPTPKKKGRIVAGSTLRAPAEQVVKCDDCGRRAPHDVHACLRFLLIDRRLLETQVSVYEKAVMGDIDARVDRMIAKVCEAPYEPIFEYEGEGRGEN